MSLTGFLVLEIVLGLSSNLTVLVLYCMKQNLVSSVSNIITMNLHVVDVLVSWGLPLPTMCSWTMAFLQLNSQNEPSG